MKKKFSEEQIAHALKQTENGISVSLITREMGISKQTLYNWRKKYSGLGIGGLKSLAQLEEQNRKLKQRLADLNLEKHFLQDMLSKNLKH